MKRHLYAIGLGANQGTPFSTLSLAVAVLARQPDMAVTGCSPVYRSAPVGPPQADFLNAAVAIESALEPTPLLMRLQAIETALGRRREVRWGPRTLDLDILWSDTSQRTETLQIPHAELAARWWAIQPMLDVFPGLRAAWEPELAAVGGARSPLCAVGPPPSTTASLREDGPLLLCSLRSRQAGPSPEEALMLLWPSLLQRCRPLVEGTVRPAAVSPPLGLNAGRARDASGLVRSGLRLIARGRWPLFAAICGPLAAPLMHRMLTVSAGPARLELLDLTRRPDGVDMRLRRCP